MELPACPSIDPDRRDRLLSGNPGPALEEFLYTLKQSDDEHGQLLYINPTRSVVIARFASHADPLNDPVSNVCFGAFDQIAKMLG